MQTKKFFFISIVSLISLLLGYIIVEITYRAYLWYVYVIKTQYTVVITDQPNLSINQTNKDNIWGYLPHNKTTQYYEFGPDGTLWSQYKVYTNNLGWVSHHDYQVKKSNDEFRIVVIGASLTACVTNSLPWTDVAQKYLNQDKYLLATLAKKKISVLNLGAAGSTIMHTWKVLFPLAMRFNPDLVFLNFSPLDFTADEAIKAVPAPSREPLLSDKKMQAQLHQIFKTEKSPLNLKIEGIDIPIACLTYPWKLSNLNCQVKPVWYIPSTLHFEINEKNVHRLKMKAAEKILLHRLVLSLKPFALMEILKHPLIPNPHQKVQSLNIPIKTGLFFDKNLTVKDQENMQGALKAFSSIKAIAPYLVAGNNPLLWELRNQAAPNALPLRYFFWKKARKQHIDVVLMDNYMPVEKGEGEWRRWFVKNGHWSNYGAKLYGKAIYEVIRERLLAKQNKLSQKQFRDEFCKLADKAYFLGMEAYNQKYFKEALAIFTHALTYYETKEKFKQYPKNFFGFLAKLYQARASVYIALKEDNKALLDWKSALALAPYQASIFSELGTYFNRTGNLTKAIEEYSKGLNISNLPDDLKESLYVQRGFAFNILGQYKDAVKDLDHYLTLAPKDYAVYKIKLSILKKIRGSR